MCGRFVQISPYNIIKETFNIGTMPFEAIPNYNAAPTQKILTVVKYDSGNELEKLNWGLVPFWAKDISFGSRMINARVETVSNKPSFRDAFKNRRCLIPADGFYEWKGEKGNKQPFFITTNSREPFVFAGLWETWTDKESDEESVYKSCTIITTEASGSIRKIHNRMPIILMPEFYDKWLNPEVQDPKELRVILQDGLIDDLQSYSVSKYVNSVKNNDPSCINPIDESYKK
jgi:putative SOS response-associated peptidase YedK